MTGLLTAKGMAISTVLRVDLCPNSLQLCIDCVAQGVWRRWDIQEPLLEPIQSREWDRSETGAITKGRAADDFSQVGIEPVPVVRHTLTGSQVPDRNHIGVTNGLSNRHP